MANFRNSESEIIKSLWNGVNQAVKKMGRPMRIFKIVPKKTAMLVIDMQNCFCSPSGSIENPDTRKITPNINKLTEACRKAKIPIIWVRMLVKSDGSNAGLWRNFQPKSPIEKSREIPLIALSSKSKESEVWKDLKVDEANDYFLEKIRYSALIKSSSKLNNLLTKLGKDTLIITGVGTNVCCESTARDAMMLDYKVIFVSDANATIGRLFHEISLMNIKMFFGDVATTHEILNEIE